MRKCTYLLKTIAPWRHVRSFPLPLQHPNQLNRPTGPQNLYTQALCVCRADYYSRGTLFFLTLICVMMDVCLFVDKAEAHSDVCFPLREHNKYITSGLSPSSKFVHWTTPSLLFEILGWNYMLLVRAVHWRELFLLIYGLGASKELCSFSKHTEITKYPSFGTTASLISHSSDPGCRSLGAGLKVRNTMTWFSLKFWSLHLPFCARPKILHKKKKGRSMFPLFCAFDCLVSFGNWSRHLSLLFQHQLLWLYIASASSLLFCRHIPSRGVAESKTG